MLALTHTLANGQANGAGSEAPNSRTIAERAQESKQVRASSSNAALFAAAAVVVCSCMRL